MPYITILDYSTKKVHIHPYEKNNEKDAVDILTDLGYRESDCSYMCTDKLKLTIHSTDEED